MAKIEKSTDPTKKLSNSDYFVHLREIESIEERRDRENASWDFIAENRGFTKPKTAKPCN